MRLLGLTIAAVVVLGLLAVLWGKFVVAGRGDEPPEPHGDVPVIPDGLRGR